MVHLGAANGLTGGSRGRRRMNKKFMPDVLKEDHSAVGGFAMGPVSMDAAPPEEPSGGEGDAARPFADYGSTTPRRQPDQKLLDEHRGGEGDTT